MTEIEVPGSLIRDSLLPVGKIRSEIRRRSNPHEFLNVKESELAAYLEDGWVVDRQLKRSTKVRRPKPHDVEFEDLVWATFARLNFEFLNADRQLSIPYGENESDRQQVDVFAADDEVALVIECKSFEVRKSRQFKKEVEAIAGQRPGMINAIRKEFPNHKVKFIVASSGAAVSEKTLERFDGASIVHMSRDTIEYYSNLASHLGKAARYQLLGSLFASQKIPEIDATVPAIRGKMGGREYYMFMIEPSRLLKLGYVLHRNRANSELMPTYQRLIKKSRLKKVAAFVDDGGFFPNSLIVNIDTDRRRGLRFDRMPKSAGDDAKAMGILHLPKVYRAAYIIDGQHRLYGFAGSTRAETEQIPVVAFVNMERPEQVRIFMEINENQKAVPKNLRDTLNADLLWDSENLRDRAKAIRLRVAQHLGESLASPLYDRVLVGENPRSNLRCISVDAIGKGIARGGFIGTYTPNTVKSEGVMTGPDSDATYRRVSEYLSLSFDHIAEKIPDQYILGNAEGGFVFRNSGIEAIARVLGDVLTHLADQGVETRLETPAELFEQSRFYIDPLVEHLDSRSYEQGLEYRRLYGSGAATKYWRLLQIAIRVARSDFNPTGLDAYLEAEEKAFNEDAFVLVRDLELHLNSRVRGLLEDRFGVAWHKKGVPNQVWVDAVALAATKNRDLDFEDEVEPWDCLHLIDYKKVLTQNHGLWVDLFESEFTRPGEESIKWKSKLSWMDELNRIRNENVHSYSVTEDEYEFLLALAAWLLDGS